MEHRVYIIVRTPVQTYNGEHKDAGVSCITATRIAVRGSWWHIRHKDGSISKHNGGYVDRQHRLSESCVGKRWCLGIDEAYQSAILECCHGVWHAARNSEKYEWTEVAQMVLADGCMTFREIGMILGREEGKS